jgi:hypothetical protein
MTGSRGSRARANTGEMIWNHPRYLESFKLSINKDPSEGEGKGGDKAIAVL